MTLKIVLLLSILSNGVLGQTPSPPNPQQFLNKKSKDFYERGILSLQERWQQVIDTDGAYIGQS